MLCPPTQQQQRWQQSREQTSFRTPGNKQVNPVNPAGHTGLYTLPCFPQGTILLDTGASTSIIRDQELLTDVVAREPPLTSLTNGGLHSCDYGGVYHGLQQPLSVWYAPDSVGNILALCDIRRLSCHNGHGRPSGFPCTPTG